MAGHPHRLVLRTRSRLIRGHHLGFFGVWSTDLRWAFTTRIALLLFAVPGLLSVGASLTLARLVLSGGSLSTMDAVLRSWPVRLAGNAVTNDEMDALTREHLRGPRE